MRSSLVVCPSDPQGRGADRLHGSDTACAPVAPGATPLRHRIGLRTVELVQQPAQPPAPGQPNGTSFYFLVNKVPIFAKGSNLIPLDVFSPRATAERARWLLGRAAAANMNMVRVWGGGRYLPDWFYDAADELGLMLWQEMIFACALYPRDAAFLSLVTTEVSQQVARLHSHASIVIWGGSNENEYAMQWYNESRADRDTYVADYAKLYLDTMRPAIVASDPSGRPFVDSSPSNELRSTEPYVKRWGDNPQAPSWGDTHYYNYDADCEDPTTYPLARFISEHGFQSFPSYESYAPVTDAARGDHSRDSWVLFYRQRHQNGNEQVEKMMGRHYRVPPANATSAAAATAAATASGAASGAASAHTIASRNQSTLFADYLWLTQLQQARCYETAFAQWRRQRSEPANTMGVLYWQLNDIWPGPSWSTIEFDGTPKLAHHAVARVFAPTLVSAVEAPPGMLSVHVTSDQTKAQEGTLTVELFAWADAPAKSLATRAIEASVPALTSKRVYVLSLEELLGGAQTTRNASFVRLRFGGVEAFHWLAPMKDALLPRASVRVVGTAVLAADTASVTLRADRTAAFVSLSSLHVAGAFGDGVFPLLAGEERNVSFTARTPPADAWASFRGGLRVRSLRDSYD